MTNVFKTREEANQFGKKAFFLFTLFEVIFSFSAMAVIFTGSLAVLSIQIFSGGVMILLFISNRYCCLVWRFWNGGFKRSGRK